MVGPVDGGDIVEERPEEVVLGDVLVEATDHLHDLGRVVEIAGRCGPYPSCTHRVLGTVFEGQDGGERTLFSLWTWRWVSASSSARPR